MKTFASIVLLASTSLNLVLAGQPINVQVTLRGKKYPISNVATVSELQATVESVTGLSATKQSLLYNGQKLKSAEQDELDGYGVSEGSVINVVPLSTKKKSASLASTAAGAEADVGMAGASGPGGIDMEKLMGEAGIDKEKLQELMKDMPGAGPNGEMPDMSQSVGMMKDLMNNPMMQQMLTDPERLEQSRQMILNNPMMKSLMAEVPGFDEVLNDKEKWRESMVAAANMYKDLDPEMMEQMMKGMSGGFGAGGMGGLGDALAPPPTALDELSEGDE